MLRIILSLFLPILVFANSPICDGNTYEINQCLKTQMQTYDKKLDSLKDSNIKDFKKYRDNICSKISSTYSGGTYESIKYGNCIISLDRWYLKELEI
ncbi:lysozyme inhibitor LprI family protein [Francisella philomiragia]|uniref:Lysozyme inhibitor LprI N-terminal domain-containing protein n=1 Tax=Francisella philomiragia subsp. philomiragia (strain ATCC 25017 / CCUG 19701 / FSC 153 / O\|nr:hypothetical protein BF30_132 [Francisella philomiragia]AJI48610.1 hypothetical protein KU46_1419 [Francisella philomiragia]